MAEVGKSAYEFYGSSEVAASYEHGRAARIFVKNLPAVLTAARFAQHLPDIPLYALFDWLYNKRLYDLSLSMLGNEVLDIACGTSYVYRMLISDGWTGKVTGMDYSPAMLAEGGRRLLHMLSYEPPHVLVSEGLFQYEDVLGRSVIDISPPQSLIDQDSLSYLIDNRYIGNVTELPKRRYASITAFSGPFCFFSIDEQRELVVDVCKRADMLVSFQFKNIKFATLDASPNAIRRVAAAIMHILDSRMSGAYAFLASAQFQPVRAGLSVYGSAGVQHEVGGFLYYPTSLHLVKKWLNAAGFRIVRAGTMGFMSQIFYELSARYYEKFKSNPSLLEYMFRTVAAIDEYFCTEVLAGDNLQITAVRTGGFRPNGIDYSPSGTFRNGYTVRS
jgi:hypothetical protein